MTAVPSIGNWRNNAEMIRDIASMDVYLRKDWTTLDCTYGLGNFWKLWQPNSLIGCDIELAKSPVGFAVDFTQLSLVFGYEIFDVTVFDPPYMLNGKSTNRGPATKNAAYGVNTPYMPVKDKMLLMLEGLRECIIATKRDGFILVKCMDQVVSGKVFWQTDLLTTACYVDADWVDMFHLKKEPSAQPPGRRQLHSRRNYSTLLVFQRR